MRKLIVAMAVLCSGTVAMAQNPFQYLLIGTNADGKDGGIHVYRFNPNKGEATFVSKVETGYPTYLAVSKDQKFVYAVNEYPGKDDGDASAFALDKTKGQLTFLNKQTTGGTSPCYITVDSTGKNVVVANYAGGNLALFKTGGDGTLQPALQNLAHEGYGVNVTRQEMPHPHCAVFSPDEKYMYSCDLGNDRIYHYKFNAANATTPLTDAEPAYTTLEDGVGPRHITFSADGRYAYVMTELAGKLLVYEVKDGNLTEIQSLPTAKAGEKSDMGGADIHITPNGKFLYVSTRGKANEITIFKVNSDGKLLEAGHQPVGLHPRNFMIDPTGRFLLVANRDSNNIQIFVINKNYGLLEDTHTTIQINKPVCLKMVPVR